MNFAITLVVSIIIAPPVLIAQNKKLDSLYAVLDNHPQEDTNRVNTLIRTCYYEYTSYPEKNKQHAEEAKRISEKIQFTKGIGLSLRYISLYYWVKGDYEQAGDFAFQMLKVFEEQGNEEGLAKSYTLIGLINEEWGNFDKAKENHLKSLEINRRLNRLYDLAYNYNSLGALYNKFDKDKEAMDYFKKSLALRKEINDEDGMSQSYINLARINKPDEAIDYYSKALTIAKKLGNINRLSIIATGLGDLYIATKQFEKADTTLNDARILALKVGNKKMLRDIYKSLLSLERERNHYKKALEYSLLEKTYQDSLFTEEKTKQLAEIEARYEAEKKEHAIQVLERDNSIKKLWQNILIASLGVVFLAAALYYYVQRLRIRRNQELLKGQEVVNDKLKELDKMRSQFIASISHELRTPLTLIKGPVEEWLQHPERQLTIEKAEMINRNSNRLLRLVNQLLDLSKLDAGNLKLDTKQGDIIKFLRVISSSFDSYAQRHGIIYYTRIPETPLFTSFDHDKLETVVYNLLSNAFKFTPSEGKIEFIVSWETPRLMIEVSDSGQGISADHIGHIFDRFYRAGNQSGNEHEGTGIGLSLVKEVVSLMQGTIQVQSDPNKRTTFQVDLPIEELALTPPEISIPDPEGKSSVIKKMPLLDDTSQQVEKESVLIVDDNTDMLSFLADQLRNYYAILVATNGKDGLRLARREIPDIIITDIMMPQMDGIEFCAAIKKDSLTSHIPVIMLTAKEGLENKLEGLEAGADEYITKPFDGRELLVRTKNLIAQRQQLHSKFAQQVVLQPKNISITSADALFLERVEAAIEQNLSSPEFGVPQLQDFLAMSKTQFHRKLKALTDHAPGEFLREYRLKRASQLLEQEGGNITEIAFAVGFGSLSYFTRSFKELYGLSPSEYAQHKKLSMN